MIKMAVEVGGTFTDLIWLEDGKVRSQKVPSTPEDASEGVISGLQAELGEEEMHVQQAEAGEEKMQI